MLLTLLLRRLLATGLLAVMLVPAWAQVPATDAVLHGRVLDADTRQPVPNAQVGIGHNRLGTSTSPDGRFALRVPAAYQGTELEVALLGYQRYHRPLPPLPGPELVVLLKSSPATLGTVTVAASATGIIREAVRRIPLNYPTRPTQLTGFYRESDDEARSQCYDYLAEGVLQVYKPGYQHPNEAGYVRILQSRRVELRSAADSGNNLRLGRIGWIAGGLVPHRFDFVKQRLDFINEKHFRDYQYSFSQQTTYQGRPVYVIAFGPRPGTDRADFAGQLYIDEQRYVFLGAEWHRTPAGIRRERLLSFEATERAYRADYQEFAGRYYLKSVWYNTLGKPWRGQVRHHLAEYLTTAIDTGQVKPPAYPERSQYGDIFLRNPVPYDSAFWQSQTTLLPAPALRRALLDQARDRRADSLLRRPAAPLLPNAAVPAPLPQPARPPNGANPNRPPYRPRLGYGLAAGVLALDATGADLLADVAPAGYSFRAVAAGRAPAVAAVPVTELWYLLELPWQLQARAGTHSAFGALRGGGWAAGLTWQPNLNPRGRPLRARVSLDYVRQRLLCPLGTYDNPDAGLKLAGQHLGDDRLEVALQTNTATLRPALGLSLELSRRWSLTLDAAYRWPLRTRAQLVVQETGFWSGSAAELSLPASEATVQVAGQPADALPWQPGRLQVSLGVVRWNQ